MTDAINTNNQIKTPNPATDQRARSSVKGASNTPSSNPASAIVELSSDEVLKQMKNLPEVDSKRIEAIKSALSNGEYNPDPEVIARKFSEIERLLP